MPSETARPGRAGDPSADSIRRRWRSRRVVVRDASMAPTLLPGDRLLVDPAALRDALPPLGSIVVARDPEQADRLLVKRVAALPGERSPEGSIVPRGRVYLVGDDPATSRDSRAFGPVALDGLLGLAWYRYAPPGRVGPLIGSRRA